MNKYVLQNKKGCAVEKRDSCFSDYLLRVVKQGDGNYLIRYTLRIGFVYFIIILISHYKLIIIFIKKNTQNEKELEVFYFVTMNRNESS